ncbi:MAG TPA: hypothetical protein VHF07_04800, partial [Nitrospiraceae bacterium]|nr:hypothetical protein [Nitrospiraceae bacterium]
VPDVAQRGQGEGGPTGCDVEQAGARDARAPARERGQLDRPAEHAGLSRRAVGRLAADGVDDPGAGQPDQVVHADAQVQAASSAVDQDPLVLERRPLDAVTEEAIHSATAAFRGRIRQMPPMYSAVKIQGVPLYKSAREGLVIERAMREVTVHRLDVEHIGGRDVHLRIQCSKGTYIRTLCADIGEALHVGGHLLSLERTKVGPLTVEEAITLEEFERRLHEGLGPASLLSLDAVLTGLHACTIGREAAHKVLHGVPVPYEAVLGWETRPGDERPSHEGPIRIKDSEGRLLAIGTLQKSRGVGDRTAAMPAIAVKKLLVSEEPATCAS